MKQPFCTRRIPIQSIAFLLVLQEGGRHQPSNRQTKTTGFWPFVVKAIFSLVDYTFSSLLQLLSSDRTSFLVLYKTFPIAPWILCLFPLKIWAFSFKVLVQFQKHKVLIEWPENKNLKLNASPGFFIQAIFGFSFTNNWKWTCLWYYCNQRSIVVLHIWPSIKLGSNCLLIKE